MSDQTLQDSGSRRQFKSGAVRDRGTLKPRPDLISPHAMLREGIIFALGAEKYELRNWELGLPISECLASAQRHIEQFKRGDTDEDHLAQARWNLGAMIHFEEEIKAGRLPTELDDMPHYAKSPEQKPFIERVDYPSEVACPGCHLEVCDPNCIGVPDPIKEWIDRTVARAGNTVDNTPICRFCGASIPPIVGEGTCPKCNLPQESPEPPTFYIAGPMTGIEQLNFPAFDAVAKLAREQGFNVINPAELDREHDIDLIADPECVDRAQKADPNWIQTIIQRDVEVIIGLNKDRGDGLILLPSWSKSTGARAEVAVALWLGLTFHITNEPAKMLWEIHPDSIKRQLFYQRD